MTAFVTLAIERALAPAPLPNHDPAEPAENRNEADFDRLAEIACLLLQRLENGIANWPPNEPTLASAYERLVAVQHIAATAENLREVMRQVAASRHVLAAPHIKPEHIANCPS